MKLGMKKLFFLTLVFASVLFNSKCIASTLKKVITCPEQSALSTMFENNWLLENSKYHSYVEIQLASGNILAGNLANITNELPTDRSPHLLFDVITVQNIDHYSLWNIVCRYTIQNSELHSYDFHLNMATSVSNDDYTCSVTSKDTVACTSLT